MRKETGFFLSIEKSATFLNCELIKLLEEKKLLYHDPLKRNVIRDCSLRNKRILYCLMPDPSWICKN